MARSASGGAARRALLLTCLRAADWCALAAMWEPGGDWCWGVATSIALATVLSWLVLRDDRDVIGWFPPCIAVLLQLDPLIEAFGGGPRMLLHIGRERARPELELPTRVQPTEEDASTSSFGSSQGSVAMLGSETVLLPQQTDRATSRLRIARKLMVARLPESMFSTIMGLWVVVESAQQWRGWQGPASPGMGPVPPSEVGASTFNHWFWDSPHQIILRICESCQASHKRIFYRRFTGRRVWEPFSYMTSNWTEVDNEFHGDFDLYSTYRDAIRNASRWEYCSFEAGDGFPGNCAPGATPADHQWSKLGGEEAEGQVNVSFQVERTLQLHDLLQNPLSAGRLRVTLSCLFAVVAIAGVATGIADVVVWMWIQTDFVKSYSRLVVLFYFLEVCSWLPLIVIVYSDQGSAMTLQMLLIHLMLMISLITCGFHHKQIRKRRSLIGRMGDLVGQTLLAASLAPLVFLVNFLFFDRSLTFRTLNNWYYVLRFLHAGVIIAQLPLAFTNPACVLVIASSALLALMVWGIVPRLRRQREEGMVRLFAAHSAHRSSSGDLEQALQSDLKFAATLSEQADCCFVEVLNTVGDTFEALLLASRAGSPRVRQAVLEVAVAPLADASRELLRQLLPLILPQLLLALRWRTVEEGEDERCPLSRFLLAYILEAQDQHLVSVVYWQLFALSADRAGEAHQVYRAMRGRLLQALEDSNFCEQEYDQGFCQSALALVADQCRLYYQMRCIARMIGRVQASHTEKTLFLRNMLASADFFKRFHNVSCFSARPASGRGSMLGSPRDLQRMQQRGRVRERLARWGLWTQRRAAEPDPVREELSQDVLLQAYENRDLDLMRPGGRSLPVDPSLGIAAVDEARSFVVQSAVAPTVICCRPSLGCDQSSRRLLAVKIGDDLRQDALILQMFRLMQTTWEENGLRELTLRPYTVLPVSPQEGIVSFVPRATKVSSILFECEGDVARWIEGHNSSDPGAAFDRLCGSTAGYCVATYLLGVGDRHLDNLMITEDGHFFHIDFGFVLGDDPKPLAPAIRLPREVVEAIRASNRYERFKELVAKAFSLLRRTSRLWTSLLSLTKEAGGNGVSALKHHGLELLMERFHLGLDEAAAQLEVVAEVEASVASAVPVLFDKLHQLSLFWN